MSLKKSNYLCTKLFYNGEFLKDTGIICYIDSSKYSMKGYALHTFEPIGLRLEITKSKANTIYELENRLALDVIEEIIGKIEQNEIDSSSHPFFLIGKNENVNEYSLVFDFRIADNSEYHCFYQANESNGNDGEIFINTSGKIGRLTSGPGYSNYSVNTDEWYRVVISIDLESFFRIYLDGALILDGDPLSLDNSYGLYAAAEENLVHFFADDNGEDNEIDIALAAIFDHPLNQAEVTTLGGYGHNITPILLGVFPYLQTPSPTSIYISWHSLETSSTLVEYGTDELLGSTTSGTVEDISGKKWHTVQLTGLTPDTEYTLG